VLYFLATRDCGCWASKVERLKGAERTLLLFSSQTEVSLPEFEEDVEQIKELVKLVERYGLAELSLENGDMFVSVKCCSSPAPPAQITISPTPSVEAEPASEPAQRPGAFEAESDEEELVKIVAPLVGVFYRAPAHDAPPFIEVGDRVEVGQEIGLIEAMKVFSPIPSDSAGIVVEIPARNGELVQQGDTLVLLRPDKE